jgi:hypothetical protein
MLASYVCRVLYGILELESNPWLSIHAVIAGLLELENSMPDFILKPVVKAPKRQATTQAGFLRRKYRDEKQLADIHKVVILIMADVA